MVFPALHSLRWVFLALVLGLFLDVYSHSSIHEISSLSEVGQFSLPVEIRGSGTVSGVHASGSALVFSVENQGSLSCYFRHPAPSFFLFSGETIRFWARIEPTPRGPLCVIQEVFPGVVP